MPLRVAVGMAIMKKQLNSSLLADAWDPSKSGKVVKGEFRQHLRKLIVEQGMGEPNVKDVDAIFDSYDSDGSGSIDLSELKVLLEALTKAAVKYDADRGSMRQEKLAKAIKLRSLAGLVTEAESLLARAEKLEADLQDFKVEISANLQSQLGLACARRRIRAADFIGQFTASGHPMIKEEFCAMAHNLVFSANTLEMEQLFEKIDADSSGTLELREIVNALNDMQRHGNEMYKDRDSRTRKAERVRRKAEAKVKQVFDNQKSTEKMNAVPSVDVSIASTEDVTQTSSQRAARAREKRIKAIAQAAVRRLPKRKLGMCALPTRRRNSSLTCTPTHLSTNSALNHVAIRGFNAWLDFVEARRAKMRELRLGAIHLLLRDFYRGWNRWVESYHESVRIRQVMQGALSRLQAQELTRGFVGWKTACPPRYPSNRGLASKTSSPSQLESICEALRACLSPKSAEGRGGDE